MKTRKHLLTLLLVIAPLLAFSQSDEQNGPLNINKFWDNWFISAGGGIQTLIGDGYHRNLGHDFTNSDYYTPFVSVSVGKWLTPVFALRLQGMGYELYDRYHYGNHKVSYINAHGDVMVSLFNLFGRQDKDRRFDIIPFLGAGYAYTFKNDDITYRENPVEEPFHYGHANSFTLNGGILFRFGLSNAVDLNLEANAALLQKKFNHSEGEGDHYPYNGLAAVSLGLTYKFKKRGFDVCQPDQDEINRLNARINSLQSDLNACLARTCPPCPACPEPQPQVVQQAAPAAIGVVRFSIGSAVIKPEQQINVYNAADYLKNNPGVNLKVVGYADKKTGNANINMRLSEKRAKAVTKMLVDKYGISENRIETSWDGDTVQPYSVNEWNRVVIFVPRN